MLRSVSIVGSHLKLRSLSSSVAMLKTIYFMYPTLVVLLTGLKIGSSCNSEEFECDNGKCVPLRFVCDNDNDCGDYSDQQGCNVQENTFLQSPFGKEYFLHSSSATFNGAVKLCSEQNSSLLVLDSVAEMQFLVREYLRRPIDFWLGLRNEPRTKYFRKWIDGSALEFAAWAEDYPKDRHQCSAAFFQLDQKWRECECSSCEYRVFCSRRVNLTISEQFVEGECDKNEFRCVKQRHCIRQSSVCDGDDTDCFDRSDEENCEINDEFVDSPFGGQFILANSTDLSRASALCNDMNASLPVFVSKDEQDWVWKNIAQQTRFWLGLRNKANSRTYINWADGSPLNYTDWTNQPRLSGPCVGVFVNATGHWQECECSKCGYVRTVCMRGNNSQMSIAQFSIRESVCDRFQFECQDASLCIPKAYRCDGQVDCADLSDEANCDVTCKRDQFKCEHGRKCIPIGHRCDGDHDCEDSSDEDHCDYSANQLPINERAWKPKLEVTNEQKVSVVRPSELIPLMVTICIMIIGVVLIGLGLAFFSWRYLKRRANEPIVQMKCLKDDYLCEVLETGD